MPTIFHITENPIPSLTAAFCRRMCRICFYVGVASAEPIWLMPAIALCPSVWPWDRQPVQLPLSVHRIAGPPVHCRWDSCKSCSFNRDTPDRHTRSRSPCRTLESMSPSLTGHRPRNPYRLSSKLSTSVISAPYTSFKYLRPY